MMTKEEIVKEAKKVITSYLGKKETPQALSEIFFINSDETNKQLLAHLKGMTALLNKAIEIIEANDE